MNLTNSQYNQLMVHYMEQRGRAMDELDERRAEVYGRIPELADVDSQARKLSIAFVREGGTNEGKNGKAYRQKMEELKRKRIRLLSTQGWDEHYLEPVYECPDCKDTGYVGTEKCHCLKKRAILLFYKQSNMAPILDEENFDHFDLSLYPDDMVDPVTGMTSRDIMQEVYDVALRFVEDFDDGSHNNLFLYGDTGVGKTFLSHCIAKELLDQGHSVLYLSAIRLFELLEARQFNREMDYREKDSMLSYLIDSDLLILDDLGTELTNGFTNSQLYHVIEGRLAGRKSTIISTNLSIRDMNEQYSERIFSRIMSHYRNLRLVGDDIRLIKR